MRVTACLLCLIFSWVALPAAAEDDSVVGNWLLVSMEIDGKPSEDDDEGKRRLVLTKDGKMEAWDGEELDDRGWYELKKNNKLVVYEDTDEDGELDKEEKESGVEISWSRKDKELVLTGPMDPDDKDSPVIKITLKLIDE